MRVLGIDPGLQNMGWGVIELDGPRLRHIANGVVRSGPGALGARLLLLYRGLTDVITAHLPDAAAVEQTFVNKDAVGTLKLGQARGIALLAPAEAGLEIGEYAPNAVESRGRCRPCRERAGAAHGAPPASRRRVSRARRGGCTRHRDLPRASPAIAQRAHQGKRMIGRIAGVILHRAPDHVMIDVRGVGYIVHISERMAANLPPVGQATALYTDLLVREDLLQLFGFPTLLEKEWHKLLTSVQGIGAKASLAILGTLGAEGLGRAIALGDWSAVRKAQGVGPKLAQRVVLELKDKAPSVMAMGGALTVDAGASVIETDAPAPAAPAQPAAKPAAKDPSSAAAQSEALSALTNLGYNPSEAASAVAQAAQAEPEAATTALIRAALRLLAPKE